MAEGEIKEIRGRKRKEEMKGDEDGRKRKEQKRGRKGKMKRKRS